MLTDERRAIIAHHAAMPLRLLIGDLLSLACFLIAAFVAMGSSVLVLAAVTGLSPFEAARADTLAQIHGVVGLIAMAALGIVSGRRYGVAAGQAMLGVRGLDEEGQPVDARYLFVRLLTNLFLGGALSLIGPIMVGLVRPGLAGAAGLMACGVAVTVGVLAFRRDRSGRTPGFAAASIVPVAPGQVDAYRADLEAAGLLGVSPYWSKGGAADTAEA
ncbi:MAG: hypothetical protein AAF899_02195 [Pseudomonadota bacterium]